MGLVSTLVLAAMTLCCVHAGEIPTGSCGAHSSPDCLNDMGSCGNACCAAEFKSEKSAATLFDEITSYLKESGSDGLFGSNGGAAGLSGLPGGWTAIFQGTHTTFTKRYVDTLNFALRPNLAVDSGSVVRVFSISDIAGALGDMGQNRRTVSLMASDLDLGDMQVLFGCGTSPSLPTAKSVAHEMLGAVGVASTSDAFSLVVFGIMMTLLALGVGLIIGRSLEARKASTESVYAQLS